MEAVTHHMRLDYPWDSLCTTMFVPYPQTTDLQWGHRNQPRNNKTNQCIQVTTTASSSDTQSSIRANSSIPVPTDSRVYSTKAFCSKLSAPSNTGWTGSNDRPNDENDETSYSVSLAVDVADYVKTVKQYHHHTHRGTKFESGILQVVVTKW